MSNKTPYEDTRQVKITKVVFTSILFCIEMSKIVLATMALIRGRILLKGKIRNYLISK